MLGGSFLSGSSPAGGGAAAFPVFTKALHVPSAVARTFGLLIQSVGMTMAVASILAFRRSIIARAALLGSLAAVAGFVLTVLVFGKPDDLFWPLSIGTPWVKATFSIVLATTSIMMILHSRRADHHHVGSPHWTRRHDIGVIVAAAAGGVLSAMAGTGANILVFLFLVVLVDVNPKVALPTAIIVMTAVSIVGLIMFGIYDGQLNIGLAEDRVVSVNGQPADLGASEADLLGLWLAAIPVAAWGAPLGSLAASLVKARALVVFVAILAGTEVITTIILVPELRTEPALALYLAVGLIAVPATCVMLRRHRKALFSPGL